MKRFFVLMCLFVFGCVQEPCAPTPTPTATPTPTQTVAPTATPTPTPTQTVAPVVVGKTDLFKLVDGTSCTKHRFNNRGSASRGYMRGVALVFAKAVCNPSRPDVVLVSKARPDPESVWDATDVTSWYRSDFTALGMSNDADGVDTLRHVYTLLLSLGMQESSGTLCCGRDMSADYSTADSAEAGAWQASYGSRRSSSILVPMFDSYKKNPAGCFADTFSSGLTCGAANLQNWGTGEGVEWQRLTKACPAFAAEWTSVLLRTTGGTRGEFGPIRRKAAEIAPECDVMLKNVQDFVLSNKSICEVLKN
jgi:hypothetical protein